MNKPLTQSAFTSSLRLASAAGLLIVLAGSAAYAQATEYDVNGTASQLGTSAVTTDPYPIGDNQLYVPSPFVTNVGGVTATFTATNGIRFESFTNAPPSGSTANTEDFPTGTQLLDTFDADAAPGGSPTGPLRIDFSSGVSAFGLSVQNGFPDDENFTFSAFNGTTLLNNSAFTTGFYDNTTDTASGKSLFLGAQATGGSLITSVLISSSSLAPDSNGKLVDSGHSNDFFFGPLSINSAPVPEASTTVSFGLLLMLGLAGAFAASRKQKSAKKASAEG